MLLHNFDKKKKKLNQINNYWSIHLAFKFVIRQISYIPYDNYPKDFAFIVNKEEYHTNKLIADLLSKNI